MTHPITYQILSRIVFLFLSLQPIIIDTSYFKNWHSTKFWKPGSTLVIY